MELDRAPVPQVAIIVAGGSGGLLRRLLTAGRPPAEDVHLAEIPALYDRIRERGMADNVVHRPTGRVFGRGGGA